MVTTQTPESLPPEVLRRRDHLPRKPEPVFLHGEHVRLEPIDVVRHLEGLFSVSNGSPITLDERSIGAYDADQLIWRYMIDGPFASLEAFENFVRLHANNPSGLAFCVTDILSSQPIGMANFLNNTPEHLRLELGSIWYSPIAQRTAANTEATYLMLEHAFTLGYRRVEWKCDARNARSRLAALRMGFQFEGIQQQHMIVKGRSRATAWYRILDGEWPQVRAHLAGLLQSHQDGRTN